jgi:ubiquinone/menaquinone biosynthesis C-methylase UbiE
VITSRSSRFVPAAGYGWLTPLYDPMQRWLLREGTIKQRLVAEATVGPGQRVLDLGCGTGTLGILLLRQHPHARFVGLDRDAGILRRAQAKAGRARTPMHLDQGTAVQLPYVDGTFDWVLASLMLHHLTPADQRQALHEAFRVLRPGGQILVADFGRPQTLAGRAAGLMLRRFEQAADFLEGKLPLLLHEAGLQEVREIDTYQTVFGTVALYSGLKPEG